MPLAMTQFLSARYQQAGPDAGLQERRHGDAGQLDEAPASIRVPAIESPMTT